MKTYTVSRMSDGIESLVGKVVFDGDAAPRLTEVVAGADGERLRSEWEALTAKPSLPMEVRQPVEVGGRQLIELNTTLVKRGDTRYPDAVWSYLEKTHGYLVDVEY
ncbi:MAG: hypothetical protein ACRCT8_03790 [Lacipirellulaceae bacterium]